MDCAKGSAVAGLYDDLLVEILSRLPVKDLRRSKCVSKPWRHLISDPLDRKKLPQDTGGLLPRWMRLLPRQLRAFHQPGGDGRV
ncbi:hypothetical protein BAE44_0019782 [Dichanthelium oligosanthes]|uniref:F-box domain-containing protein n=1 Tax=Dichanthelium oligosanthes TaxID=888268 RepID=A0A1E5V220_9POAL|nr:hypothetical protein BAE44_0019782 [Dichanthelium oligosanthes]